MVPERFAHSPHMKSTERLEAPGLERTSCNVKIPKTARSDCGQHRADPGQGQGGLNQKCCNKFLLPGSLM